ncbi:unnamed protein product [Notodromas monacha]|uniref:Aquaporin n=1 Tax=Notodromas monacha TaxID=399045 RepID=A0A7R9GAA9_9CRUS|nr:unnamed protein product [Notodromas monacha]CAG0915159.1 unnamed protein product [Notodromas monacha]
MNAVNSLNKLGETATATSCRLSEVSLHFQAIAHVSGGHINPAVSIGFFTCRRMTLVKTLLYIFAQSLGAITGSAILQVRQSLRCLSWSSQNGMLGVTVLATQITSVQGLAIEIIITFMLVFLIVSTTDGGRQDVSGSVPLAIGIYIVGAAFAAGPLTGGSMNPARSLGPAVITGHWKAHWVYWAGPLAGGALAGLLYSNLFDAKYVVEPENEDADTPAPLASPPVRTQQAPYHLQGIHYQPEESYNSRRIINSYDAKGAKF